MKKLISFAIGTTIFLTSVSANASVISQKMSELESKYSERSNVVAVVFYSEKNPYSVVGNVKNLMHTRDVGALFYPYWVPTFYETEVDKKSGCGLVVGKWYDSNYPSRGSWEPIMQKGLPRITDNAIFVYMRNGKWTPTEGQEGHLDAIENICG